MFPGLFKGRFLNLLLLLFGIMLVFLCFAGSVHYGKFSENGLKSWRNQEFGEKAEADHELH